MSTIAPAQPVTMPAPSPGVPGQDPAAPELYRFTVDQYVRMGDAGILTEDDRVELVEGLIYRKPMKKGPHSITCRETFKILDRMVPAQAYFVTREDPVGVPGWESMPEPDISIVRGRSRDYTEQPRASDVPLIVEVAATKSRLAYDQGETESLSQRRNPRLLDRQPGRSPGGGLFHSRADWLRHPGSARAGTCPVRGARWRGGRANRRREPPTVMSGREMVSQPVISVCAEPIRR